MFLHGLGGSRTSWEPQLTGLKSEFRCIAWDMPGYGASDPVAPLTFATIADSVARLLDAAAVERAHLVGESFGGMHALHTALRHPERVGPPRAGQHQPRLRPRRHRPRRLAGRPPRPLDAGRTPADIAEQVLTSVAGPSLDAGDSGHAGRRLRPHPVDGLRAAVECLPSHNLLDRLAEINTPALVVAGARLDAETPPSYARALAEGLPDAERVGGAGRCDEQATWPSQKPPRPSTSEHAPS